MKITVFGASTSTQSINKQLATYVGGLVPDGELEVLDLNDYELPIFSEDLEKQLLIEGGQPAAATQFRNALASADALIVSFAEHNGNYTAAYKNLFDWCTRQGRDVYAEKPTMLLSTSKGPRGATSVLEIATNSLARFSADIRAYVSVPSFYENFDVEKGCITNPYIEEELRQGVESLIA